MNKKRETTKESKQKTIGARQFIETYAANILLKAFTLAQSIILARLLGPEMRGEYAAIILWPTIIANIGNLGTGLATTRATAASRDDVGPVARTSILISILLSVITTSIGLTVLPMLIPNTNTTITELAYIYMFFAVPALIISANLAGIDQGQGDFFRLNLFRVLQSPINVLFLIALIALAATDLVYCLWALIASIWITTLGRFFLVLRDHSIWGSIYAPLKLLRNGLPFALVNTLGQFMHRGDRILLLWLLSERDLGLYAVAYSVASIIANLAQSMGLVTLTITAQEKVGEGFGRVSKIFRGSVIISVAVGLIQVIAIYLLLPIVYGQEYADARIISVILAWGIIFTGFTSILGQGMRGQGKPMSGIPPNLAGFTVMVLISLALSPTLGVIGVAIGFVIAQAIRTFGWILMTVRHYNDASISDMIPTSQDASFVYKRIKQLAASVIAKARNKYS
jgi:O-antigen/teichoic acid export membrane protein